MDGEPFNTALLALLGRTDGVAAERALLQLLRRGSGRMQVAAMRELLGRGGALDAQVARQIPTLDEPARRVLLDEPELTDPVCRAGLRDSDDVVRMAVMEMVVAANRPHSAYLLLAGLTDGAPPVRKLAAGGLDKLVRTCRGDREAMARHVVPAVTRAMRNIAAHRSVELITAAIRLGALCEAEVFEILDAPANQLTGLAAEALRAMAPAEAADFVFLAMRYPHVGSVARAYVAQASWPILAALGRRDHWRLLRPIGAAIEQVHHLRAVADDPAALGDLAAEAQPAALRMVLACGVAAKLRRTLLSEALAGPAAVAQAALPYALAGPDSGADLVLMALHSRHAGVQAAAAGRILAGEVDANITQHLLGSLADLAEPARSTLGQFLAARSFDRYWRGYARLGSEVAATAGRALLKLDGCVAELLSGRLVGRDVGEQVQAIQMVRQIRDADRFASLLARLARRGDRMVRSAAVAALGGVADFDARSTLARCLDDPDMRVQANAVEALAQLGCDSSAVLDKLDSPNNRVRANTIKWLLETDHPQAPMALATMLTDSRPAHRISALWVAGVLRYRPAEALIRRLAVTDPDVKIRARMATTVRTLAAAGDEALEATA